MISDLSRYHLSVIDELYENRNEEELIIHLEKKYEQLKEFKKIKEIDPPVHLCPYSPAIPGSRIPLAQLPARGKLGWYSGR